MATKVEYEGLPDKIYGIINLLCLAILAYQTGRPQLIPTALETACEKMQDLVEDYCVEEDAN